MSNQAILNRFKVKYLADGRAMLNLACGDRMHPGWNNLDFSPLSYLVKHRSIASLLHKAHILSEKRFMRILKSDPELIRWDLRRGIPFADDVFDVVYHSHFLEHLSPENAHAFVQECFRVVKPGGLIRVVVPDLEIRCRNYMDTLTRLFQDNNPQILVEHQENIRRLIDQMVRTELAGTAEQPYLVRIIERFLRGDAAKAGETHRWMYDQFTLGEALKHAGFKDIRAESPATGRVTGWSDFGLDIRGDSSSHKDHSIYIEAVK